MHKYFTELVDFIGSRPRAFEKTKKYISTGALKGNKISEDDVEIVDFKTRPSRADLEVKTGDILFAKMAYTDKRLLIGEVESNYIYSTGFFAIKPKEGILTSKCLYYLLSSNTFKNQKDANSTGATQKAITIEGLKKINLRVPEYNKQDQIGSILENVERIIKYKQQQLAEYNQLIKSRFVEMFGDSKENHKRWRKSKVSDILDVRGRVGWKGYKKEDLRQNGPLVLGATQINQNGDIDLSSPVYLSEEKYVESPEIMLRVNDLVFTQRGNTIGKTGLLEQNIGKATINPCVLILRPLKVNPKFLKIYFTLENTIHDMWELNSGSAQPMITQKGIKEYKIINPPIVLQDEFADFVVQVDKLKFEVQKSLDETQILFDSLMQEYFG